MSCITSQSVTFLLITVRATSGTPSRAQHQTGAAPLSGSPAGRHCAGESAIGRPPIGTAARHPHHLCLHATGTINFHSLAPGSGHSAECTPAHGSGVYLLNFDAGIRICAYDSLRFETSPGRTGRFRDRPLTASASLLPFLPGPAARPALWSISQRCSAVAALSSSGSLPAPGLAPGCLLAGSLPNLPRAMSALLLASPSASCTNPRIKQCMMLL